MRPLEVNAAGRWLSLFGDVGDISYSFTWGVDGTPSGCELAEWSFVYPNESTPPMLRRGVAVELHDGSGVPVWTGISTEPERDGDVWRCHARGYGFEANRFKALDSSGLPTTDANAAITAAINRGLPWVAPSTNLFPLGSLGPSETVQINSLADLLDFAATKTGKRWRVGSDRTPTLTADPTTPSWVAAPEVLPPGVADDDYVSVLIGRYISAMTGTPPRPSAYGTVTVTDDDAIARWGRVEKDIDYTTLGVVLDPVNFVQVDLQNRMELAGARMGYTNALELTRDVLTTFGGVHASPGQVKAGPNGMLRLSRFLDVAGNLALGLTTDIVLQRTTYNQSGDVVTAEPMGLVARDLESILASPEAPETQGVEIDG